jgi:hypothetical protein
MKRNFLRQIKYWLWALNGLVGKKFRLESMRKVTVLIAYYNPARMVHVNHQLRNIAKCDFVDRIVVSNHNPDLRIEALIHVKDKRITTLNQNVRRGCGYRWDVALGFSPEYLIVIDDDLLLFPSQIKILADKLMSDPERPHGFAGMIQDENGYIEYTELGDQSVDYLCEIYAITGKQLQNYMALREKAVTSDISLVPVVENAADFVIVSKTGHRKPQIHRAGRLFRCPTYNETGIAVHKEAEFQNNLLDVSKALE